MTEYLFSQTTTTEPAGQRYLKIPAEHLVKLDYNIRNMDGQPRLPSDITAPYGGLRNLTTEQRAQFFYKQAMGSLALAKYYAEMPNDR